MTTIEPFGPEDMSLKLERLYSSTLSDLMDREGFIFLTNVQRHVRESPVLYGCNDHCSHAYLSNSLHYHAMLNRVYNESTQLDYR